MLLYKLEAEAEGKIAQFLYNYVEYFTSSIVYRLVLLYYCVVTMI